MAGSALTRPSRIAADGEKIVEASGPGQSDDVMPVLNKLLYPILYFRGLWASVVRRAVSVSRLQKGRWRTGYMRRHSEAGKKSFGAKHAVRRGFLSGSKGKRARIPLEPNGRRQVEPTIAHDRLCGWNRIGGDALIDGKIPS